MVTLESECECGCPSLGRVITGDWSQSVWSAGAGDPSWVTPGPAQELVIIHFAIVPAQRGVGLSSIS